MGSLIKHVNLILQTLDHNFGLKLMQFSAKKEAKVLEKWILTSARDFESWAGKCPFKDHILRFGQRLFLGDGTGLLVWDQCVNFCKLVRILEAFGH